MMTLTPQQVRVLMMLSEGLLNKQIAYELGVSEATIKAHVSAILQKLGVESRTQAVILPDRSPAASGGRTSAGAFLGIRRFRNGRGRPDPSRAWECLPFGRDARSPQDGFVR